MIKGYIYKYEFPDGKCYIGQTTREIEERHKEHITESTGKANPKLWEYFQKYGDDYKLTKLSEIQRDNTMNLIDKLNSLEELYIEEYDSVANGLNVKSGGGNWSYDKDKLDAYYFNEFSNRVMPYGELIDSIVKKYDLYFKGKREALTEEEYALIEKAEKEFKLFGGLLDYIDKDLKFKKLEECGFYLLYESVHQWLSSVVEEDIEEELNQYVLEHKDEIISSMTPVTITPIEMYNLDTGKIIKTFCNRKEVDDYFGRNRAYSNVYNVCKGKQKSAYGYGFRYMGTTNGAPTA